MSEVWRRLSNAGYRRLAAARAGFSCIGASRGGRGSESFHVLRPACRPGSPFTSRIRFPALLGRTRGGVRGAAVPESSRTTIGARGHGRTAGRASQATPRSAGFTASARSAPPLLTSSPLFERSARSAREVSWRRGREAEHHRAPRPPGGASHSKPCRRSARGPTPELQQAITQSQQRASAMRSFSSPTQDAARRSSCVA